MAQNSGSPDFSTKVLAAICRMRLTLANGNQDICPAQFFSLRPEPASTPESLRVPSFRDGLPLQIKVVIIQYIMKIKEYYQGKTLLVTGCTGFLGKVVLEKILRSLDVKKIYLLIRPKKGIQIMERAKKEIFSSQIFDHLKTQHDDFMAFIDQKIVPVEGDIAEPKLIFNEEKLLDIIENVNVIINNAASIDFNLRLDQSIQINYFGPQRLLALAKRCKNCEVFTHVSTCYVNSEKTGYIDERIYEYAEDPDDVIARLQKMPESEMLQNTKSLIAPWPNTYTFTKNLAERALEKHRGSFPILVLRPAIIICAYQQPYPGWLDSLAAAGAISMLISSGAVHYFASDIHNRGDIIPVDFVSNSILIGTAFQAKQDSLAIQHCGSSHTNSITWHKYISNVMDYARMQPMEQRLGSLRFRIVSQSTFEKLFYLEHTLPAKIMTGVSQYVGTQQFKKNVQRLNKLNDKILQIYDLLKDFTLNDWCFETKRIMDLLDQMDPEERMEFNCNPKTIDWTLGSVLNVYGIQKFMMKMDVYLPNEQSSLIPKINSSFFQDTSHFLAKSSKIRNKSLDKIIDKVLFSDRVQTEIRKHAGGGFSNDANYYSHLKACKEFLKALSSTVDRKTIQGCFLVFHQRFKKIFDQIVVNDADLRQVSELSQQKGKSVVLIPSFKSYLDFVLLVYINIMYEIDLPFISGLAQFSDIAVVTKLLRRCGGFFVDYKKLSHPLFKLLFEEFLSQMVRSQQLIGYHIERRRERSGKIVKPIQFIFEYIVDSYLRNHEEIDDLLLVPVTINYDKIYEGQQFPFELLGDVGKRESVLKILGSIFWINEQYGRVHVKYCKPISLKEKVNEYSKTTQVDMKLLLCKQEEQQQQLERVQAVKSDFTEKLSMELVYTLSNNLVIMSTNMVAAVLIHKRRGGITEDELIKRVSWLYDEILIRGGSTSLNAKPSKQTIRNALGYLKNFIDTTKQDLLSPQVKANKDYKNYLMLAYYRNNLIHLFLNECYIAASFLAFGEQTTAQQGVSLQRVWDQTEFLVQVMKDEFLVRDQIQDKDQFMSIIKFMEKRGYIQMVGQDSIKLTKPGKFPLRFFSSLILPFVESYWVTLSFLKTMKPKQQYLQQDIEQRVQWLAETLYDEGFLIYYDSCSLEPIGNAVQRYSTLDLLIKKGQPYSIQNQQPEVYFSMCEDREKLKEIYERMTFFKPPLTLITQILNFEDDVQRILAKTPSRHMAKL